jgi:mersacidin/lichenicidin family type 2 lantibiotic
MNTEQIVRSWKNEDYRLGLSLDEQALLPECPAGLIELSDQELLGIDGGSDASVVINVVSATVSIYVAVTNGINAISYFFCK